MMWSYSLSDLEKFIDSLNSFHQNIKFTYNVSETNVTFLDVDVHIDGDQNISTKVHVKPTNIHQYVEYSSSHPRSCKDGIPLSQAKRYRRICSNDDQFENMLSDLRQYFVVRNYPMSVIDTAFDYVKTCSLEDALNPSEKSDRICDRI